MKTLCLTLSCIVSLICYSQKDGYDVVLLGKNLYDVSLTDRYEYELKTVDSLNFRLRSKISMSICGEQTDYFDIEINPDSTIKKIEVYTIGKLYRTGEDYYKNYRSISKCMVDNIGKPDYMDGGNNKPDGMKTVGWRFPDSKTIFMIYTYDAPIQTDQVKRLYKMVWTNYEPDKNKGL